MSRMKHQTFGLWLFVLVGLIAMVIIAQIGGTSNEYMMVAALVGLGLVGAVLTHRSNGRGMAIVGLVCTLAITAMTWYLVFGISHFFSPLDFITAMLFIAAFIFSIVGATQSIRGKGDPTDGRSSRQKQVAGVIGLLAVVSVVGFFTTKTSVSADAAAGSFHVDMAEFEFHPADFSVASGTPLLVSNSDMFAHDLKIPDEDVYLPLGPGSEVLLDVSDLAPGTYTYICSLHAFSNEDGVYEGMVGTLTIEG